jgi:hypothetical protein
MNFVYKTIPNLYDLEILLLIISILLVAGIPLLRIPDFKKIIVNNQKFFIKYYPSLPLCLTICGFFIFFISITSIYSILMLFGLIIGLIISMCGLFLWAIMRNIIIYFENQISYTIYEANRIMSSPNEPQQIKRFVRFINLTLKNINLEFGQKIKLNISGSGIYQFETVFQDYLPFYLQRCSTRELDTLKDHVERMSNSVSSDNNVDFKTFTNELIQLSNEITNFLKNNNLKIMYHSSPLSFFKDINNIKNLFISFTMILYVIILILLVFGKIPISDVSQIPHP